MCLHLQRKLLERVAIPGRTAAADAKGPGHFADVDIVFRVQCQPVRRDKTAGRGAVRRAPACEQLAFRIKNAEARMTHFGDGRALTERVVALVPRQFRHVNIALGIKAQMRRALRIRPLFKELTIRAENLNAVDLAVAYPDAAIGGTRNAMRQTELAWSVAWPPPGTNQLPRRRENMNTRIAVAIGDVNLPLGADGDIRRPVERWSRALDA